MLSSRLNAFVIPTSQKSATTIAEHVVRDELDAKPGGDRDPGGRELGDELRDRAQVPDVVDEPCDEQDPAAREDPGQLPRRLDRADGERQRDAGRETAGDADAAERRRGALVPPLAGGHATSRRRDGGGAQEGPEGERRDRQGGDRDGRFHGGSKGSGRPRRVLCSAPTWAASRNQRDATLSVCCLTRGPTARVAAQLALLRDVADEIVVGLDTSVAAELAHPLEDVADVLVHYPYADPVDRPVGWVHSLCTRDWILWVDDDEIPSAAARVDRARRDRRPSRDPLLRPPPHALAATRRASSSGRRGSPTSSCGSCRTTARVVWFPGITHWPIQAIGPHRYLDTPLYHTDLLLNPVERRRAKVRRYEARDPGPARRRAADERRLLPAGGPRGAHVAPIDPADRETVARILALEPWPEPRPPAQPDPRRHARGGRRALARRAGDRRALPRSGRARRRAGAVRARRAARRRRARRERGHACLAAGGRRLARRSGSPTAGSTTPAPSSSRTGCGRRFRLRSRPKRSLDRPGRRPRPAGRPGGTRSSSTCSTSTSAGSAARRRRRWTCGPRSASRSSARTSEAATAAAAALAEVAPSVRPLLLTSSPERTTDAPRLPGRARRAGVRPGRREAGRVVRATAGALARRRRSSATPRCFGRGRGHGSPRPRGTRFSTRLELTRTRSSSSATARFAASGRARGAPATRAAVLAAGDVVGLETRPSGPRVRARRALASGWRRSFAGSRHAGRDGAPGRRRPPRSADAACSSPAGSASSARIWPARSSTRAPRDDRRLAHADARRDVGERRRVRGRRRGPRARRTRHRTPARAPLAARTSSSTSRARRATSTR